MPRRASASTTRASKAKPPSPIPIRSEMLADLPPTLETSATRTAARAKTQSAPLLAVTPTQGAKLLQIGYRQFYALLMAGEIASFTIGRSRRVPVTAIEAFMCERLQAEAARLGVVSA